MLTMTCDSIFHTAAVMAFGVPWAVYRGEKAGVKSESVSAHTHLDLAGHL